MVSQASGLKATEKDRWNRLQVRCQDRWGQPVYHFENAIPHRADFGHAAESNQFAVNYNEQIIGGVFRNLAQEVEWRISAYAGSGVKVLDRKSTRLNSSHSQISYAVFCLKKKKK